MPRRRTGEVRRILAHLDLLDDRLAIGMQKLDRILDRHHVVVTLAVDQIHQRGQRGTFPAARRTSYQHEPLPRFG